MARLTKADAARQLGIARSTLYKLLDQGTLSATPDGLIDSTELVRVAPLVDSLKQRTRTSSAPLPTPAWLFVPNPRQSKIGCQPVRIGSKNCPRTCQKTAFLTLDRH